MGRRELRARSQPQLLASWVTEESVHGGASPGVTWHVSYAGAGASPHDNASPGGYAAQIAAASSLVIKFGLKGRLW